MRHEWHQIRKSKLSEEVIKEIAEKLKQRYYTLSEIEAMTKAYGYKGSKEIIFSLFDVRGYLLTEQTIKCLAEKKKKGTCCTKVVYKIVTKEDYEKYEREAHENAKRRLLAAVSY